MRILGIIPARAGSKGIPKKNIKELCGKRLIDYTLDAVENSILVNGYNDIYLSTDIPNLGCKYYGELRPDYLTEDNVKMIDVVKYCLRVMGNLRKYDAVCLLQPTSPLRTAHDINLAIDTFIQTKASSLYSGYYMGIKHKDKTYDKHIDKPHFQRNGAIFIAKTELIEQGELWDDDVIEFEMPKSRSIDIDDMDDWYIAESIIKNGGLL